jgi:hypothetical protein
MRLASRDGDAILDAVPGTMIHFHLFWSKPHLARQRRRGTMELLDFQALTWITGALEIRRHSPMHLITDSEGAAFFRNSGLAWIYDEISTALDGMPADIDPAVFWDGGKVFAFQWIPTPCVMMDYDAILWRELPPDAPVIALHEEPRDLSFYATNRQRFSRFGFDSPDWNWDLNPVNTALVHFADNGVPHAMGRRAVQFMREYSAALRRGDVEEAGTPAVYNRATLFAGQRLLPMFADRAGLPVRTLTRLNRDRVTIEPNPWCMHLWLSKALYKCFPEPRAAYCNHLIDRLRARHPEAMPTLKRLGLDRHRVADPEDALDFRKLSRNDLRRRQLRRLREVRGEVWIEDVNVPVRRRAEEGAWLLPGERLHPGPGASWETEPAESADPEPQLT